MTSWRTGLVRGRVGRPLLSWLEEAGSLTARCQRRCSRFGIRLLGFGPGRPLGTEGALIALRQHGDFLVREVLLECDGSPVIFAHTVLRRRPRGKLGRWLAGLGNRSLGSLLFVHPGFSRGGMEFLRLDHRHPLHRRAIKATGATAGELWARRSLHRLGRQDVLVIEVFLPAILMLRRR